MADPLTLPHFPHSEHRAHLRRLYCYACHSFTGQLHSYTAALNMRIYRNLVAVLLTSGCASAQNSTANSTSSANSSSSSADIPALPPTGEGSLKPFALATNSSSFVTARSGKLYLDGQDYTFSTFNNVGLPSNNLPA